MSGGWPFKGNVSWSEGRLFSSRDRVGVGRKQNGRNSASTGPSARGIHPGAAPLNSYALPSLTR
jgi:hypothetical protein